MKNKRFTEVSNICPTTTLNTFSNQLSVQEMKFIIDTFSVVNGACTVTHNVLVDLPVKNGQTIYKIRPLVEYAAFFWDPWQRVY